MNSTAIIVIAYNRPQSLRRLLDSLTNAYYPDGVNVPLVISVDKSDSSDVEEIARDYVWEHGDKSVRTYEKNLGLRQHVLLCGDLTSEYGGIIMLEDDLYVSPSFYMYTTAAFSRTGMDPGVGGISLYSHRLNVHVREPFEAVEDGYDNYYMQLASSWGQAFLPEQWAGFRSWYEEHGNDDIAAANVPVNISSWSEKSWLKYYIKYLIDTDKYFLYPRVSFTTNFGDEGTHADSSVNDLQVPLAGIRKYGQIDFHFSNLDESGAVYDAYFENMRLEDRLPASVRGEVSIDMYGYRQEEGYKRYILSGKAYPCRILESFGRRLRPIDANVIYKIEGKDFFLYDTDKPGTAPKTDDVGRYLYNFRALKAKEMTEILKYRIRSRLPLGKNKK
jgi:glycosyltransferase involved in cell wall biosynthesis